MAYHTGVSVSRGELGIFVPKPLTIKEIIGLGLPNKRLPREINLWRKDNRSNLWRGLKTVLKAKALNIPAQYGVLYLAVMRPDVPDRILNELLGEYVANHIPGVSFPYWTGQRGIRHEAMFYGLASLRVVTDAGVNFIVDAFQNTTELENLKYHGIGTGSTAEAAGDTALVTELTTEYSPDNTRATGTTTEGGGTNVYRTVGTNTLDGTPGAALREHGIFDQAATGGGTLLDRTVYASITLSSGDSLQSTYDHTQTAGS
jgi:hypothetical protein